MRAKIAVSVILVLILFGCAVRMHPGSVYACSRSLIKAIEQENFPAIQEIVSKHPECINAPDTMLSANVLAFLCEQRPAYPLITACATGNFDVVQFLVDHGADVNCSDGRTPLSLTYSAKPENWYLISRYLIDNGAQLDYRTEYSGKHSSIIRDIACVRPGAALAGYEPENYDEVMAAFHYAIAHCDPKQIDWEIALFAAISNERIDMVRVILENGYCDINVQSQQGPTALMIAVRDSDTNMVNELLHLGANKHLVDRKGETAYDWAVRFGKRDLLLLLRNE